MLDEKGRVSTRKGIKQITNNISDSATANTLIVKSLGEYINTTGVKTIFAGAGANVYKINTSNTPYTLDVQTFSGGTTKSDGNWQFTNFNNQFYGVQAGNQPINYSGSAWLDLEDVGSYAKPSGVTTFTPSCILGEYGRLWVGDIGENRDVVYYSDTLIGQTFTGGASGSIDLKTVWGGDEIVALASFMGKLIIFGKNNIVVYNDPWNPAAATFVLDEVIEGVGCVARDSVQLIGDDIVFLSASGVRSLGRTMQQDKMPLTDLSLAVKDELRTFITTADMTKVKAQYDLSTGSYLLGFPDRNVVYVFDFKAVTPDGAPRITTWNFETKKNPKSYLSTTDTLYMGLGHLNYEGRVASYDGYYDVEKEDVTSSYGTSGACTTAGNIWESGTSKCFADVDNTYQSDFKTVWLDFDQPGISKFLKRFLGVWSGGKNMDVTLSWYRDYSITPTSASFSLDPTSGGIPFLWGKQLINNVVQANSTLYGTTTVTTTTAGSFVVGTYYAIASLGNTTQAQWNTAAGTSGLTYIVGSVFQAATVGVGTGTVVSHTHSGSQHAATAKYAPSFSPAEYKVSMSKAAKVVRLEITQTVKGFKAALQNITIWAKQGKIR
tara:strand:- start:6626 stop:8443 length:1818 start_codon:yes stop_codon:yes gene_type:complete